MTNGDRREFLSGAAFFAGVTAGSILGSAPARAGDVSFMNNVPDPTVSGKDLPNFKYAMERDSKPKVMGGSSAREATVEEFPISKGMAGVSMHLEPGAMRELHWHATAAEWAYVNSGRVRTTVFGPDGTQETNDFEPGDVWFFPRGHGHVLECLGSEPCHFVLIFDNGYFSEFGTFSITDWIGHAQPDLLAKTFRLPASTFKSFPKDEVYFAKGAPPPARAANPIGGLKPSPLTHKWRLLKNDPYVDKDGGRLYLVDSTKFPISTTMTGAVLELDTGALRGLHWHPNADEWQYVLDGKVSVTLFGSHGRYRTEVLEKGDVGYIPQGYGHSLENVGSHRARVLIGFNSGLYQDIELTDWIAANPADVLETNFGQPASVIEKFPKSDVFIAR